MDSQDRHAKRSQEHEQNGTGRVREQLVPGRPPADKTPLTFSPSRRMVAVRGLLATSPVFGEPVSGSYGYCENSHVN